MTSSSEVYIQATETDPAVQAQTAIGQTHQRLQSRLAALISPGAGAGIGEHGPAALAAFCSGELCRHLAATDQALYAPAAGAAGTRLLIRALRATSAGLGHHIGALRSARDAASAAAIAYSIDAVLAVHLTVEQTVLLAALATLPGIDLPALASDLQTLLGDGQLERPAVIDVREIPHGQRHPRIFARYARLAPGEAFTLISNHDPKPLRREFEATHPGVFTWNYLESGPDQWQVRIGRAAASA